MKKVARVCYFVSPAKEAVYINGTLRIESFSIRSWRNVFKLFYFVEETEVSTDERIRTYPVNLSEIYDEKSQAVLHIKEEYKSISNGGYHGGHVGAPWL